MVLRYVVILLFFYLPLNGMETKTPADLFTGAAAAGNIKGINYWIHQGLKTQIHNTWGRSPLSLAAGNGQVEAVKELVNKHNAQIDFQDQNGLTPLAWAVQFSNRSKSLDDYLEVIKFLIAKGANVNHSAQGITVLHNAARGGNIEIIQLLFNNNAQNSIHSEGHQDKGRTPLQEAIRASADAITHVDLENNTTATQEQFPGLLAEAIKQFHEKQEKKLSTNQLIQVINLLKRYGAQTHMVDALGKKLDYYINEVQVISDNDRVQLLGALNFPLTPRIIQYTRANLPEAIGRLQQLKEIIPHQEFNHKIDMTIWSMQDAYKDANASSAHDKLRIAMALLSKVKEIAKNAIQDATFFYDIENALNGIRTILRDAALTITGKAQLTPAQKPPARPLPAPKLRRPLPQPPMAITTPAPTIPPAKPATRTSSQRKPTTQIIFSELETPEFLQPSKPTTPSYRAPEFGILIANLQNNYNKPVTFRSILDYPGGDMELPEYNEDESTIPPRSTKMVKEFLADKFSSITVNTDKDSLSLSVDLDKAAVYVSGKQYSINPYKISDIVVNRDGKITVNPLPLK